jgi:hypothetical protein
MSQEWLYRASGALEGPDVTRELATEFGFICRTAYTEGTETLIAHVASVDFGDVIHLYFAGPTSGTLLGAFRVVGPVKHPHPEFFGKAVHKTKLRTVLDGPLKDYLAEKATGYTADPTLKLFTGWPIVPEETRSPSYIKEMFPGRNALVKR